MGYEPGFVSGISRLNPLVSELFIPFPLSCGVYPKMGSLNGDEPVDGMEFALNFQKRMIFFLFFHPYFGDVTTAMVGSEVVLVNGVPPGGSGWQGGSPTGSMRGKPDPKESEVDEL